MHAWVALHTRAARWAIRRQLLQRDVDEIGCQRRKDDGGQDPEAQGRPEALFEQAEEIGISDLRGRGLDVCDWTNFRDDFVGEKGMLDAGEFNEDGEQVDGDG